MLFEAVGGGRAQVLLFFAFGVMQYEESNTLLNIHTVSLTKIVIGVIIPELLLLHSAICFHQNVSHDAVYMHAAAVQRGQTRPVANIAGLPLKEAPGLTQLTPATHQLAGRQVSTSAKVHSRVSVPT